MYTNGFDSVDDIEERFETKIGNDVIVLFAVYHGDYGGQAFVLFQQNGKLYEVNASHCSCMGLEGQWNPEETTIESIEHTLTHGEKFMYALEPEDTQQLKILLDVLKECRNINFGTIGGA